MNIKEKLLQLWDDHVWYTWEYRIKRYFRDIERWIAFRTYDKYNVVKTDLEPNYYDKDALILHVNFSLLTDFVEIEKASMQHYLSQRGEKSRIFSRRMRFSSVPQEEKRKLGLEYLDWEINNDDEYFPENQRKTAKEVKELYLWWKDIYPNRPDPWDVFEKELGVFPEITFKEGKISDNLTPKEKKNKISVYKKISKLEEKYHKEEEDMLIRLMKIRLSLWT